MDKYHFEQEDVLSNKLGITDSDRLKEAEAAICHARTLELAANPVEGNFDFTHLKRIHERLFGDLYDFAGKARDINLAKGHSRFCQAIHIDSSQRAIFEQLKREEYLCGLDKATFAHRLAYFSAELNGLHPFREGNGRAIRIFLMQLANNAGYELALHEADSEALLLADVAAFNGCLKPLVEILCCIVRPPGD